MVTVNDVILKGRALIDEYTDDGTIIPTGEVADIEAKMILFADMGQKELYDVGRLFKSKKFTNKPITPVGGLFSGFNIEICTGAGDVKYWPDEDGDELNKSYYVEANQSHTIEIQEFEGAAWQTLITHTGVALEPMTAYKGNITPTTVENKIRMKISGSTYFEYINTAFFPYTFVTVPDYRPWIHVEMPDDFRKIDAVVEEFPIRQHQESSTYKWEEPNIFIYNYYWEGSYNIIYKPIPTKLTTKDDILEIDDITAEALAFYVASWIAPFESQSMTNPLFQKFTELKLLMTTIQPSTEELITNIYGGVNYA